MVDRLKRDVDGGVAADGDIGPAQVVVDGGGDADHINPKLAEHIRAGLRPVAADHHHAVDAALGEVAKRLRPAAFLAEFRRPGAAEKRAADLNDAAHVARAELPELTIDQALPTLEHAVYRHTLIERAACDGAYSRIHAGGITTTRKDRDVLHKFETMTVCPGSLPRLHPFLIRNTKRSLPADRQGARWVVEWLTN